MREKLRGILVAIAVAVGVLAPMVPVVVSTPVAAANDCVDTNLFGCVQTDDEGGGIVRILKLVVSILLYGIGAAAVIGVVIAGILYLTARDNEAQVEKAKKFLFEIAIGLIAWAMLFTILHWLIPGFDDFK